MTRHITITARIYHFTSIYFRYNIDGLQFKKTFKETAILFFVLLMIPYTFLD